MQVKTRTEYAMRVLLYLAEHRTTVATAQIASACGMNENYVPKVMRILKANGWSSSDYGNTGGYRLTVNPQKITLLDIMNATEDSDNISTFSAPGAPCRCKTKDEQNLVYVFEQFQLLYKLYFSSITLEMLAKESNPDSFIQPLYQYMEGKAGRCSNE